MKLDELTRAAHPEKLSAFLAKQPKGGHHHGGGRRRDTREADHKGHHIVIRTTYRIEVDGRVTRCAAGRRQRWPRPLPFAAELSIQFGHRHGETID